MEETRYDELVKSLTLEDVVIYGNVGNTLGLSNASGVWLEGPEGRRIGRILEATSSPLIGANFGVRARNMAAIPKVEAAGLLNKPWQKGGGVFAALSVQRLKPLPLEATFGFRHRFANVYDGGGHAWPQYEYIITVDGEDYEIGTLGLCFIGKGGFGGEAAPKIADRIPSTPPSFIHHYRPTVQDIRGHADASIDMNRIHWDYTVAGTMGDPCPIVHGPWIINHAATLAAAKFAEGSLDRVKSFDAPRVGAKLYHDPEPPEGESSQTETVTTELWHDGSRVFARVKVLEANRHPKDPTRPEIVEATGKGKAVKGDRVVLDNVEIVLAEAA